MSLKAALYRRLAELAQQAAILADLETDLDAALAVRCRCRRRFVRLRVLDAPRVIE